MYTNCKGIKDLPSDRRKEKWVKGRGLAGRGASSCDKYQKHYKFMPSESPGDQSTAQFSSDISSTIIATGKLI